MAKKNKIGRPPKYETPEDLQAKTDEYFEYCKKYDEIPNVLGYTVFLGFADRKSLLEQETRGEDFSHIIKKAKTRMYNEKLQGAMKGKLNPTIFIFDAVNNHGMINRRTEEKELQDEPYIIQVNRNELDKSWLSELTDEQLDTLIEVSEKLQSS